MQPVPPAAPPIAAPETVMPDMRPVITKGKGSAARELLTQGPTQLALQNEAQKTRESGVEQVADLQEQAVLRQAMAAQVSKDEAMGRHQGATAAVAEQQRQLAEANQKTAQAREEGGQVAPITDYWADRGAGSRIVNAIAMAVAGFGQAISGQGGPNPVMQMLQSDMDQDLRTKQLRFQQQTSAKSAKKDAAQQYYDNLAKQFGVSGANELVAASQRDIAAREAEIRGASSKIPEIQANAAKLATELRAQGDERHANAIKYVQAQAGQQMVFDPAIGVPVPLKDYQKYKVDQAKEGYQQTGRVELAGMKEGADKSQKGAQFMAEKLATAKIPETVEVMKDAAAALRATGGKGIGTLENKAFQSGDLSRAAYQSLYGEKAVKAQQAWALAEGSMVNSLSGAGVSNEEMQTRWAPAFRGANDVNSRLRVIAEAEKRLKEQERNIAAGAGPEGAAAYRSNLAVERGPAAGATNAQTGITERAAR